MSYYVLSTIVKTMLRLICITTMQTDVKHPLNEHGDRFVRTRGFVLETDSLVRFIACERAFQINVYELVVTLTLRIDLCGSTD